MIKKIICIILLPLSLFAFKPENTAENLKDFFVTLRSALIEKDNQTAAAMAKSIFPTKSRVQIALKSNANPGQVNKIMAVLNGFKPKTDKAEEWVRLFSTNPERSEVQVHGATTEEIKAYEKAGIAYKEFPGGARQLAAAILRPGMTFYEVEYVVPGEQRGMKYHLIFWDGKNWCMLGPVWRGLR